MGQLRGPLSIGIEVTVASAVTVATTSISKAATLPDVTSLAVRALRGFHGKRTGEAIGIAFPPSLLFAKHTSS